MNSNLRKLIRIQIESIIDEDEDEVVANEEEEDLKSEFSSAGGAGAIGQFGYAVPLGGKSNAKSIEKKSKKK